jgi:murein DD-endopeptidase MepM/ murein hydrolase activator NlpD
MSHILKSRLLKVLIPLTIFLVPSFTFANNYTMPVNVPLASTTSWFDHDNTSSQMTAYTGTVYSGSEAALSTCSSYNNGAGCYDDHRGIDFAAPVGTNVIAAATGTVKLVGWENPLIETQGYGFRVYLYHSDYGQRTLYAHMASSTTVSLNQTIGRGIQLGVSSSTGASSGPHLHFGVYTCDCTTSTNQVDPFGWWQDTTDPWPNGTNRYLWTTDPPSFNLYKATTTDVATNITWRGNIFINNGLSVNSGVTLSLEKGTIVKFNRAASSPSSLELVVNGALDVKGTSAFPVHITSSRDDAAGGDLNGDGNSTSPAAGDWNRVVIGSNASSTVNYTNVSYGTREFFVGTPDILNIPGGILTVSNSRLGTSSDSGIYEFSGTTTVVSSHFNNHTTAGISFAFAGAPGWFSIASSTFYNNAFGISAGGPLTTTILTNNTFVNNGTAVGIGSDPFGPLDATVFTHSGNTATGTGKNAFAMSGVFTDQTWTKDNMPYSMEGPIGADLTIEPGVIVKMPDVVAVDIFGTLNAIGSPTNPIYFTSLKDDSVGGDTNGDSAATSPSAGDWADIHIYSGASTTISNAVVRYGGTSSFGYSGANLYNQGGILNFFFSTTTVAEYYGILHNSGTSNVSSSSIYGNVDYGFYNTSGATTTAENNYWGASSGPYNAGQNPFGTGNTTTDQVDFIPFLTTWP